MFDLEKAIAAWRRPYEHNRAFAEEDIEELEDSLRDRVAALVEAGLPEEAAFREARRRMGTYGTAEAEYRKVYWGKLRRRRELLSEFTWRFSMLKNYLKIAVRNLLRQTGYSFVNIAGLTVGLACCLLILLYIQHERSYDRFHEKADRIHRVVTTIEVEGRPQQTANSGGPVGPTMKETFPEVLQATRLFAANFLIQHGDQSFQESRAFYADSTLFDIFTLPMLQGNPETALAPPFTAVLSASGAEKYFGDENPVGQTLIADRTHPFTITGVVEDLPSHSHFDFDLLVSMETLEVLRPSRDDDWPLIGFFTYVLLPDSYDAAMLAAALPDFAERHTRERMTPFNATLQLDLEPLTDIYLHSTLLGQIGPTGSFVNLYVFAAVAAFLLLIAIVNFMNLATARSAMRAREVGVRKAVGARWQSLVILFLTEAALLTSVAMGSALLMAWATAPLLESLMGVPLPYALLLAPGPLALLLLATLVVSVLAGSYPAFVLTRFQPTDVLRGTFARSAHGVALRKGLVIFQFFISIALIAGTAIVYTQLGYLQDQRLGFEQEHMLVVDFGFDADVQRRNETIKRQMEAHPAVISVSVSGNIPGRFLGLVGMLLESLQGTMQTVNMNLFRVDFDFMRQYGLNIVAGRSFSQDFPSDSTDALIVNEAAVKAFGYPSAEAALGKRFEWIGRQGEIIGVISDFNYRSLHSPVEPLALWIEPSFFSFLTLKVQADDLMHTIPDLEQRWKQLVPDRPFNYTFLDATLAVQYQAEQRFGKLFGAFAALAILVACLGLFGLATFMAEQRTKEIGIRKVMGASVRSLITLLSKDFIRLVFIAFCLAVPLTYIGIQYWLESFAYRTAISWEPFLASGLAAMLIALLTVGYRAYRAAAANPVKALRYE